MTDIGEDKKLVYDPAEHRVKHCWDQPYAGVVRNGSTSIGKCPSDLTKEYARDLLDEAAYEGKVAGRLIVEVQPKRMWNVYKGVVYEAVPTQEGSYHGYPWFGRPGRNRLPRAVKAELKTRAEQQGYGKEFRDWITTYES